jgi:ADP-heptose:LPS heptosyltransferase
MNMNAEVVDGKLQTTPENLLKVKESLGLNPDEESPPIKEGLKDVILSGADINLTVSQGQSPGDILVLTASIRDLKEKFPNIHITMRTSSHEIWEHNPHVDAFGGYQGGGKNKSSSINVVGDLSKVKEGGCVEIEAHYPLINIANQCAKHFIYGFKEDLETKLGVSFDIKAFKCDIHLSGKEKTWQNQVQQTFNHSGKFWVINSGTKNDFPLKQWSRVRWQEVVDSLRGKIQFVQVGQTHHNHEPLKGVFDLVGKTDMRQLIRLCYHAEGAVCHVTMLNHLMSAWEKPCVVVAGGRETSGWESYNETTYLDTIGNLSCCKSGGCWKSKVEDCLWMEGEYPKCMNMITSADVVRAIEKYYIGGRLSW